MFYIILGIIVAIIIFSSIFTPSNNNNSDSNVNLWTIGMLADLHNKSNKKD